MVKSKSTFSQGFTIVELLIVIVVISILAAISVVAYMGVQDRARASIAAQEARQLGTKVALYHTENSRYPDALSDIGITDTAATSYQYRVDNTGSDPTYCATVSVGNKSSFVSSAVDAPKKGPCPGHGSGGVPAVTNLALNPRGRNVPGISTNHGGTHPLIRDVTVPATPDGITTAIEQRVTVATTHLVSIYNLDGLGQHSGKVRSTSLWIRANAPDYEVVPGGGFSKQSIPANTWVRIKTVEPRGGDDWGTIRLAKADGKGNVASSDRAYITGVMVVEGDTPVEDFYDGDSPNWIWNGTPYNSSSTGSI